MKPAKFCVAMSLVGIGFAISIQACGAYMNLMNSLPATGSFKAINTMSVPICKVTVFSPTDPSVSYDNEHKYKVLLAPGAEGGLSYPMKKAQDAGVPSDPDKLSMQVFACKPGNFDQMDVGTQVATIENVDVKSGTVAIR